MPRQAKILHQDKFAYSFIDVSAGPDRFDIDLPGFSASRERYISNIFLYFSPRSYSSRRNICFSPSYARRQLIVSEDLFPGSPTLFFFQKACGKATTSSAEVFSEENGRDIVLSAHSFYSHLSVTFFPAIALNCLRVGLKCK